MMRAEIMRSARTLPVLLVLTLALVGVAVWSTLRWHDTSDSAQLRLGRARDAALAAARDASVQLSTLDYRESRAEQLRTWRDIATGPLYDALANGKSDYQRLIKAGKLSTRATVAGAAVSRLDRAGDSADVLVGLDVTVETAKGSPTVQHERVVVTLQRVAGRWKASSLKPVGA